MSKSKEEARGGGDIIGEVTATEDMSRWREWVHGEIQKSDTTFDASGFLQGDVFKKSINENDDDILIFTSSTKTSSPVGGFVVVFNFWNLTEGRYDQLKKGEVLSVIPPNLPVTIRRNY